MVTTILRFVVTTMMCIGSVIYLFKDDGAHHDPVFDMSNQIKHLAKVFGNTTFVFIYHHSVSGIIYPVRPQSAVNNMFFWSHVAGSFFLIMEAFLALLAFSGYHNKCITYDNSKGEFPCAVAPLYNYNMLEIPFIG